MHILLCAGQGQSAKVDTFLAIFFKMENRYKIDGFWTSNQFRFLNAHMRLLENTMSRAWGGGQYLIIFFL